MRAGKLGALKLMRSASLGERVLALQRLVFEDPTLERIPPASQYKKAIAEIEDALADIVAQRTVEDEVERRVNEKMAHRHAEYVRDLKIEALREAAGPETPATQRRLDDLARSTNGAQLDRARRVAPEDAGRHRRTGGRDQRAAGEARVAVSAARDPLRSARRRQDDGRAARARIGEEARAHAVRRRGAVRRSERHDAALGLSRNDEPAARQRARSDLSGQPARFRRERHPRTEARPRHESARRRAVHRRDRRDGAGLADEAAQSARRQARDLRVVVLRRARPERAGVREEALRRRRAGRFHPDRRDDARTRCDRSGDPFALRRGLLRAADASADPAHRARSREAAGRAHDEDACRP